MKINQQILIKRKIKLIDFMSNEKNEFQPLNIESSNRMRVTSIPVPEEFRTQLGEGVFRVYSDRPLEEIDEEERAVLELFMKDVAAEMAELVEKVETEEDNKKGRKRLRREI